MVVIFAKNQTMVCIGAGPVLIYTDPVPLNGSDRLACIADVHSINSNSIAGPPQLVYFALLSNDGGATFLASGVTDTLVVTGAAQMVGPVNALLVRFQFAFSNPLGVGTDVAAVCFDLHVDFEHV